MTWYAAHIVMMVELKGQTQKSFPVWENVVLVRAATKTEAFAKAEAFGQGEAGDEEGSFRWQGKPAQWVFAGVRKLTECILLDDAPGDGDEVTYTELELDSLAAVKKFVQGKPTSVTVCDRFPATAKKQPAAVAPRHARRKGA